MVASGASRLECGMWHHPSQCCSRYEARGGLDFFISPRASHMQQALPLPLLASYPAFPRESYDEGDRASKQASKQRFLSCPPSLPLHHPRRRYHRCCRSQQALPSCPPVLFLHPCVTHDKNGAYLYQTYVKNNLKGSSGLRFLGPNRSEFVRERGHQGARS